MRSMPFLLWAMLALCACGGSYSQTADHSAEKSSPDATPPEAGAAGEAALSLSPWDALVEPRNLFGPVVLVSETTGVQRRDTHLKLTSDGTVEAEFEVVISNSAEAEAKVPIGFAWKTPGGQCVDPPALLVDESGASIPWIRKDTKSPPQHAAVFCVSIFYAEPTVSGDSSRTFRTGMTLSSVRQVGPTTVLGFEDRFRYNLKNYPWSHAAEEFSSQTASILEEAFGVFFPRNDSKRRALSLTCEDDLGACLRGVGLDGDAGDGRRIELALDETTGGTPISFSWSLVPGDIDTEIAALEELLPRHPNDLRLRARLLALLRIDSADIGRLLALCNELLEDWTEERAERQLLVGGNDHRFAVYGRCLEIARGGGGAYGAEARRYEAEARGYIAKRKGDPQASLSRAWLSRLLEVEAP